MVNAARRVTRSQWDSPAVIGHAHNASRPLSALEHLFWLIDQNRPVHFAVTALISSDASARDWRRALNRLQKRHPLMSVCINGEPGSIPSFNQSDAPIPLRIVEDEPEPRWELEVGEELAIPFDPSQAPLIRAVLIQGARDAAFMLVAHHSIADGLSLAYAIRDALDLLAGRTLAPLPWLASQDDIMNVPDSPTDGRELSPAQALDHAVYRPNDNARPTVKGLRLSQGLTSNLRDRARREGTTVHGALCAALVLASREVSTEWRDTPLRIMSPINVRPLINVGESCGVFVSATTSLFDEEATDFWDLARDARNSIAANQTSEYIAAGLSAFRQVVGDGAEVVTAAEFAARVFANEIMVTNLGSLAFDQRFGPVTLKALFGPAVLTGFEGQQTVGVATVNGALCLLHTGHKPPDGLLDKTQRILARACAGIDTHEIQQAGASAG